MVKFCKWILFFRSIEGDHKLHSGSTGKEKLQKDKVWAIPPTYHMGT